VLWVLVCGGGLVVFGSWTMRLYNRRLCALGACCSSARVGCQGQGTAGGAPLGGDSWRQEHGAGTLLEGGTGGRVGRTAGVDLGGARAGGCRLQAVRG
jgi:hypothetical protein